MPRQILFPTLTDLPSGQSQGDSLVANLKTGASSIVGSVAPGSTIALANTPILTLTYGLPASHPLAAVTAAAPCTTSSKLQKGRRGIRKGPASMLVWG